MLNFRFISDPYRKKNNHNKFYNLVMKILILYTENQKTVEKEDDM